MIFTFKELRIDLEKDQEVSYHLIFFNRSTKTTWEAFKKKLKEIKLENTILKYTEHTFLIVESKSTLHTECSQK